jgi:putative transposase
MLPIKEAAERLKVAVNTVRRAIARGTVTTETRMRSNSHGGTSPQIWVDIDDLARACGKPEQAGLLKLDESSQLTQPVSKLDFEPEQAGSSRQTSQETEIACTPGQIEQAGISEQAGKNAAKEPSDSTSTAKSEIVVTLGSTNLGKLEPITPEQAGFIESPTQKTSLLTPLDLSTLSQINVPVVRDPLAIPKHVLETAQSRQTWLAELQAELETAKHGDANRLVEAAATAHDLSTGTVWRLLKRNRAGGVTTLARKQRADTGKFRLPTWLLELIVTIVMTNPAMSASRLRRTLELYDPALLEYKPSPSARVTQHLSSSTIARVRIWMNGIPTLRYALMDPKKRKEFARVWAGEVFASRANELWMADMTRCDTFVYDPTSGDVFRLRIHACIDVHSGAIPAAVFSRAEDQIATNRMLTLAVLEKPEPWTERWPVHGRPERLYWDNGKTYRSSRAHLALEALGVEIIHSRPRVSHTRGNIERFFGVFHQTFESDLPGYGGPDTKSRDHDTIKRHLEATVKWLAGGGAKDKDPYPNRLLTEEEYKLKFLLWLTEDYHRQVGKRGRTRLEDFLRTATPSSRAKYDFGDLQLVFSKRETRTVRGNGTVTYANKPWGMADAGLVPYQGREIVVLINDMMPAQELLAALPEGENLRILGPLSCMDFSALGPEAVQYRKAAREKVANVKELALELQRQMTDPRYRHDQVLADKNPDIPAPEPGPPEPIQFTLSADAPDARLVRDPNAITRMTLEDLQAEFDPDGLGLIFDDDLSDMNLPKPDLSKPLTGPRGPSEES